MRTRIAVCALALLVVAACAPPGNPNASAPVAPSGPPDPSAVLRAAHAVGPVNLDPHLSTGLHDNLYIYPVYDRLIAEGENGALEPMLATGWEFSEDRSALILTLRDDVVFHDGQHFDAAAVKANLERALSIPASAVATQLSAIGSADVVDEFTVRLNLDGPAGALVNALAELGGAMISPAALGNEDLASVPVGSGPWRLVDFRAGDRLVYEAFDQYWDEGAQGVVGLELVIQSDDETRLNAIRSGQVDSTYIRGGQISQAEAAGLVVSNATLLNHVIVSLNTARAEFADPRVRRAMQHAVNREELVTATFGHEECTPGVQPWPAAYWAYSEDIGAERFAHDPELARTLLAEAGLAGGFSFTMEVSNVTAYPPVAEVLRAQFGEVGIDMRIHVTESAQVRENFQVNRSSDAALGVWGGSLDPSEYVAAAHLPGGSYNPGDLETPGIGELAQMGLEATDLKGRRPIYHEMTDILFGEEQPGSQIVLCNRTSVRVNSPQLTMNGAGVLLSGAYDWRYLTKSAS